MELSQNDIEKLNSKIGIKKLLENNTVDIDRTLRQIDYEINLASLQVDLIKLQERVIANGEKIIIIFEGRDAAGKGGAIRRMPRRLAPADISGIPRPPAPTAGCACIHGLQSSIAVAHAGLAPSMASAPVLPRKLF